MLCGFDETLLEIYPVVRLHDGSFPQRDNEALVSDNVRNRLGVGTGDTIEVKTPGEPLLLQISGFIEDTPDMLKNSAYGVFMSTEAYLAHFQEATLAEDFVFMWSLYPIAKSRMPLKIFVRSSIFPEILSVKTQN